MIEKKGKYFSNKNKVARREYDEFEDNYDELDYDVIVRSALYDKHHI